MTFETYTRSDEKTRPDKQKDNHKYKANDDDKYIERTLKEQSLLLVTFAQIAW